MVARQYEHSGDMRRGGSVIRRRRARGSRREREFGAALVEFALVVVLLLPLLLAIIELGRAWYTVQVIQTAAREGARVCAMTVGDPEDRIDLATARMQEVLEDARLEDYQFEFPDPTLPDTWGFGRPLKVVVKQPFLSFVGSLVPPLAGEIELRGTAVFNQEMP